MRIAAVLLFLVAPLGVFAQSYDEGYSHHEIGMEGSLLTGAGATYSYIFDSLFRIKTTLWAYYQEQGSSQSDWTTSFGLEFEWTFIRTDITRFYGLAGGFYFTHINKNSYVNYDSLGSPLSPITSTNAEHDFAAGIGIGIEIMVWKHIAINLDGTFEYGGVNYNPAYNNQSRYLGPGIGLGIGYRF